MTEIKLAIKNCTKCPFSKEINHWSSDGWDRMHDLVCTKMEDKKIQGCIEWHDEIGPAPDWCPILVK